MTMHDLRVFLMEEAKVQLEDDFVDKEDDLRHFIDEQIKGLAKGAKMTMLNGQFVANIFDADKPQQVGQETVKLDEYNIDKHIVKSDSDWIPENLDVTDALHYKIRVGDKTWGLLETWFKIYQAKVAVYNKSTPKNVKEDDKAKYAKCWEQIIHEALIGPVMQKIAAAIDKELEEEFTEVYKSKSEKSKEKTKKRSGKKE